TWDIILLNVTAIIGLRWISLAASTGNASIVLWLAALVFFFLPQMFAVIDLSSRMPGEGGIYFWAKETFGSFHGFITGWCYWTNMLPYFPNLLVYTAGISVFIAGSQYQGVGEDKMYVLLFSLGALWTVTVFNIIGLRLGKWVNNIGGIGSWLVGSALIVFGIICLFKFGKANPMPADSFFSGLLTTERLSFWSTMCFGFTGFELAAVLAGEVKNPRKTIPKASIHSGMIVAGIYILGTLALLVAIPREEINIISGILQGIAAMADKIGLGWASNVIALLITLGGIGGLMAWFTGASRMPFVAGIDRYLPDSFGKLHPKYKTPYIAVTVQAVIATVFILMSFLGSTVEEAYLILLDTTLLVYFIPYGYMFIIYIYIRKRDNGTDNVARFPKNKPTAIFFGICGLLTTILAMGFSLLPSSEVTNVLVFEAKIIGGVLFFLISGWIIYYVKNKQLKGK
ncbi:MAG: amino acid permease, partial [bacterium]|nr:amino acid permease [bacterium]